MAERVFQQTARLEPQWARRRGRVTVFGHVGLTLAAAYSADRLALGRFAHVRRAPVAAGYPSGWASAREGVSRFLDYRLIMVGSMLPDVIDKPLALWLAPELVDHNVRSVGHSAAFAVILLAVSWIALRWGWSQGLPALAAASVGHLVLDQMWTEPATALWPALGWAFPAGAATLAQWTSSHWRNVLSLRRDPAEVAGAVVLLVFVFKLWRSRAFGRFLRSGAVA